MTRKLLFWWTRFDVIYVWHLQSTKEEEEETSCVIHSVYLVDGFKLIDFIIDNHEARWIYDFEESYLAEQLRCTIKYSSNGWRNYSYF